MACLVSPMEGVLEGGGSFSERVVSAGSVQISLTKHHMGSIYCELNKLRGFSAWSGFLNTREQLAGVALLPFGCML